MDKTSKDILVVAYISTMGYTAVYTSYLSRNPPMHNSQIYGEDLTEKKLKKERN